MRIYPWLANDSDLAPLPFPTAAASLRNATQRSHRSETTDDLLAAFATVSRKINDLARELKCLGYFDEEGDRPRAA